MNDLGDLAVNPAWASSSVHLLLGRQQGVEERKACYHESIVRRTYLHHDGWIEERGWGKEEGSRYYVTLTTCDILRYSAPPSQPCGGLSMVTKPPAPLTDDMTTGQRVFKALARLEMARRNPNQRDALFDWAKASVSKTEYWQKVLDGLQEIDLLLDNADFGLNAVLRLIYLYGALPAHFPTPWLDAYRIQSKKDFESIPADPNFDEEIQKFIIQRLLAFKYWHDDSFRAKKEQKLQDARKAQDKTKKPKATDYQYEMQYWSENHQILFATAEYLAGQLLPDNIFRAGEHYRSKPATDYTDVNGREHMQHARSRILNWLNDRLRFGFSEWNAPGYYDEHFHAVLNLADFCLDDTIQSRACMVLDLMIFDLARFTHKGSFASAAGRAHFKHKNCGWQQSAGDMTELLFGARSGVYVDADNLSAAAFASSRRYQVPEVLLTIGQEQPEQLIDRSRLSINFDEAHEYGIGFEDEADVMRWWSRAAWFSKQVIHGTRKIVEKYDLQESKPYQKILPMTGTSADILSAAKLLGYFAAGSLAPALIPLLGNPFKQEDKVANAASVITEGSAYTRGNLYTYRNRDAMLSSVQNYRAGQMSFQGHSCQASLSMCATVFTTHPSAGGGIDQSIMKAIGMIGGGIIGGITGGLLGIVAGPLGFVGEVAGAYYGAKEGGKLLDKDIHFLDPDEDGTDGPGWWTGSVTQPRIVQMNNAAIIAYKPKAIQLLLFGHRFHAWFPKAAFDQNADRLDDEDAGNGAKPSSSFVTPMPQVKTRVSAIPSLVPVRGNANVESGAWIFGRVGDGYIGLYSGQSPQWTDSGDWKDKEVIAEGKRNIFIIQIGNKNEYGSYERFKQAVARARIHINGLHWELSDFECSYDIPRTNQQTKALGPGNDRLELHYDDQVRFRGKQFDDDNFPRFENPYITCGRVLWGQHYYTIKHPNFPHTLTHDFRALSQDASPADAKVARYIDSHERDCSLIEKLQVRVVTSGDRLSGTDNDVYFEIGPLGWKLNKPDNDDFERGSDDTYDLPLPKDIQLTTRDLVWLRLHKKGILGVDGTGDGLDGAWKPARIQLLVNESPLYEFEINKWLDSDNPMWMQIVYQANVEELFARSLRLLPNAPISSFDEDVAFITTPLFKKHGISGWWDIPQLSLACVEGTVVYPPAESTDSLATIDLDVTRLEVGRARFSFNNPQGIAHKRYLRVEYRFRMQPFPQASGAYSVPLQGQRVRICGDVKWDSDKEGWYEIHPRGPDDITIL